MKRVRAGRVAGLLMGTLAMAGAGGVEAQSVESILRARERLELTEDQVSRLDQIRAREVEARAAEEARIAELRSQLAAGQIRRSELMAAIEERQDARRARAEERRAEVDSILTEEQRATAERLRVRAGRPGPGRFQRGIGPRFGPRGRFGPARPGARGGRALRGPAFRA
ncbi:MAG TPA: Spy/CpxP family protein refolding chaperone [Longimicrobiales bacterium]|nr:Spy/CpxP family protein refolding chaperone [Longimicrobiales bacterium]